MTITSSDIELVQTTDGDPTELTNKWGEKRTVRLNREWQVRFPDGTVIGRIRYRMFTRERRSRGLRYVHARWHSPGWGYTTTDGSYELEARSRKDAVERILRSHEQHQVQ